MVARASETPIQPNAQHRYEAAAQRFRGRAAAELPWTTKIEEPGVMELISVDDVVERLDALMAAGAPRTPTG